MGCRYDLAQGEGLPVYKACLERAGVRATVGLAPVVRDGERYGALGLVRPRLGQGIFRVQVIDGYDRACGVTGERSLPVLEAAHIRPYADGGGHEISNGLLLRSDLHRLFDRGYVTFDEDHRLVVSQRLRDAYSNGRHYYAMAGTPLRQPSIPEFRPDRFT